MIGYINFLFCLLSLWHWSFLVAPCVLVFLKEDLWKRRNDRNFYAHILASYVQPVYACVFLAFYLYHRLTDYLIQSAFQEYVNYENAYHREAVHIILMYIDPVVASQVNRRAWKDPSISQRAQEQRARILGGVVMGKPTFTILSGHSHYTVQWDFFGRSRGMNYFVAPDGKRKSVIFDRHYFYKYLAKGIFRENVEFYFYHGGLKKGHYYLVQHTENVLPSLPRSMDGPSGEYSFQ